MPPITSETLDTSIVEEMDRLNTLTLPDYGIQTDGIRSFTIDSVIRGRGPNRLKYLDLEGKWNLNGKSVMCISQAFKHLERLNDAKDAFRIFSDEPLNAIGMVGWTPSEVPPKEEVKPVIKPERIIREEAPASPREALPHRSAGYGPAHQKRKLTVPDRSRSTSPSYEPTYDRKIESVTPTEGRKWDSRGDLGYISAEERYGAKSPYADRPPHRTQALSPRIETGHRKYDSEYNPYATTQERRYGDALTVSVKETTRHPQKQFEYSPKSLPSDYSSASEQGSPYARNVDDVLVTTYHMTKTTRREQTPHRTAIY